MIKKFAVDYPAFTGEEKRNLYIYLPKGYNNTDERYPVLYMFDGHNAFFDKDATYGRSWRIGKFLDKNRIKIIVVALECNTSPDDGRMFEYSPFPLIDPKTKEEYKTYADDTFKWFIKELKPFIDQELRTLKDRKHTYIMGSSMGGIMATYGITRYNHIFGKGAALSPAYLVNWKATKDFFESVQIKRETVLYTDYGENDLEGKKAIRAFMTINKVLQNKGVAITSRVVPGGKHCEECWEKQLPFVFDTLMYDKKIIR